MVLAWSAGVEALLAINAPVPEMSCQPLNVCVTVAVLFNVPGAVPLLTTALSALLEEGVVQPETVRVAVVLDLVGNVAIAPSVVAL